MEKKNEFYLCLFGGMVGAHKFYKKEYKKGVLYLFTFGLFFVGYIKDLAYLFGETFLDKKDNRKELQEQKECQKNKQIEEQMQRLNRLDQEGIPYCPRCKSTTLQYVERRKQLSFGRAIVGSLINPVVGVVGAVTSKKYKGRVKCLKCGHEWKL